jgi:hypothetical protein
MGLSRNRWILAAGVTGTAIAVVVTGAVAANAAQEDPAPPAAVAAQKEGAAQKPAPKEAAKAASTPEAPPAPAALGDVIDAGFAAKEGSWVFYAVAVDEKSLPGTHFGVMAGRRLPDGSLTTGVMANEFEGSDRAPGFHAVQAGMGVEGEQTPSFGYYVGDATKITARAGGRTVTAKQAAWSEDAAVKIFWFDPAAGAVSDLKAYDSAGRTLPAGNDQVAVG